MTLGKRVETALTARGKSQQGFGNEHDFPRGQINRIVNGRRADVTPETLMRLADGLDVSLIWLASGRGAMDARLAAAIEFARLDGIPQAVIELVAEEAGRETLHTELPSQWLERMRKTRAEAKPAAKAAATKPKAPRWPVAHPTVDFGLFHLRLRTMREVRGLSEDELSKETLRLGSRVTASDIKLLEGGTSNVGPDTAQKIASLAHALAVDPAWLGQPAEMPTPKTHAKVEKKPTRKSSAA